MKLSTSTNLLFLRPDGRIFPLPEAMALMREAGFTYLDMNFYDWSTTPGSPYMTGDWQRWLDGVLEARERLGIRYEQSHAYFFNFLDPALDRERWQHQQDQVLRSLDCCRQLGVKTAVIHPCTVFGSQRMTEDSKQANIRYIEGLLEATYRSGIVLAVENMVDRDIYPIRKYCAVPEELVELVDAVGDPRVKICWDFEHGDIMGQDQPSVLRLLGDRLAATHVSEQHGWGELYLLHRLPLTGKIQWAPILAALREIGYQGCFSYEAHNYLNALPDTCIQPALEIAYRVGEHLMTL